jgi:hypothetical protein
VEDHYFVRASLAKSSIISTSPSRMTMKSFEVSPALKQDFPYLRLPRLPVALEYLDLVFPQRRGPRAADLIHPIDHHATPSKASSIASIVPPMAARRIPTVAYWYSSVALVLRTQANFLERRRGEVSRIESSFLQR